MVSATSPARGGSFRRAALVALVWAAGALPVLTGTAFCPVARFFHVACPGCGMTRALAAMARGDVAGSLRLHALAVPTLGAEVLFAAVTVLATFTLGAPWELVRARWGRASLVLVGAVFALDVVLWALRALGAFGGPVAV
jgi:Protein of unknown function (DUF2752)